MAISARAAQKLARGLEAQNKTAAEFVDEELVQLVRRSRQWIKAINHQLGLPPEERRTQLSENRMREDIGNYEVLIRYLEARRQALETDLAVMCSDDNDDYELSRTLQDRRLRLPSRHRAM
jgi:hypothetical protein